MTIFSLQALPVKKISKLFAKVQDTEQVQGDTSEDGVVTGFGEANNDLLLPRFSFNCAAVSSYFERKISIRIRKTEALPVVQVAQIPSPPPEC